MVFIQILIVFTLIWLAVLSYLLLRTISNYNQLTKGSTNKTLSEVLSELLSHEKQTQEKIKKVLVSNDFLKKDSQKFIQKIGLVRFNPFADTGGDQSFSLAMLNELNDGIIITSLYARAGVRWYIKTIRKGKGVEHDLSREEAEALKKATH